MDTKMKVAILEIQAQVEKPTRFEQDGEWLAQLGDVNSDSLEQKIDGKWLVQTIDSILVTEETKNEIDEVRVENGIKAGAQASLDIEIKVAVLKIQV